MTVIQEGNNLCTVVVTVDAQADVMPELETHAKSGLQRFSEFEGFISGALHKSTDGLRLIQYLQWKSEAAHLKCMNHPMWNDMPSTKRFMEIVKSGRAKMVVRVVDIVAVAGRRDTNV
jgi:heme-degrading monooxygenase HmoA